MSFKKKVLQDTRYKIFYISPNIISNCIAPSNYCDYTQFRATKSHPHAGQDRGVFKEDINGYIRIISSNWDYSPGILFSKLDEYQSLLNHYSGKENWKKSKFAKRYYKFMKKSKVTDRGFQNPDEFLVGREKQIDELFESILKNNVYPTNIKKNKSEFVDNISVALTSNQELYFNNRGHHRLSISKILNIKEIPIKITLAKSSKILRDFNSESISGFHDIKQVFKSKVGSKNLKKNIINFNYDKKLKKRDKENIKYQDLVIKDGKFVGKFEELYQKFSDPWDALKKNRLGKNLNYQVIMNFCKQLKKSKKMTTLEIGCGYPQISNELYQKKFKVYGTDISETVIKKSKIKYPNLKNNLFVSDFLNFQLYEKLNPDILILSDVSWYVLPELKKFIKWYKSLKRKTYLIHSLAVYDKNIQKYGTDYFFDLESIKLFFKLNYLSSGYIENINGDKHTFFLAKNF